MTRILLIEDHGVFRAGVAAVLENTPEFVLVAAIDAGQGAIAAIDEHKPDIVLLDLRLPDVSGLEILRHLRAAGSPVKVIVVSSHDSDHVIRQAMALGARGYVVKRAGVVQLLAALKAVSQGRTYLSPDAEAQLAEHLNQATLSAREIQILRLAAQGMTNVQIGKEVSISERTVKFHINSILQKLQAADRTHAVALALRRGILDL
ncbi:MAG: response regulator transcription factor [Deltaproteobacteria bacterium]|nr:response regulator transcription factor [Deltaproteobacteria bacterium]